MFQLTSNPIDETKLKRELDDPRAGALVTFEGWVRNHNEGRAVSSLEYEAFAALAEKEAEKILDEARARFEVFHIACVHRIGHLKIGEVAVWVGATSAHRGASFEACQYIIDEIKTRLPIWKKEHYTSGETEWVNCQECYKRSRKNQGRELLIESPTVS